MVGEELIVFAETTIGAQPGSLFRRLWKSFGEDEN